jgi:hypothetical protein
VGIVGTVWGGLLSRVPPRIGFALEAQQIDARIKAKLEIPSWARPHKYLDRPKFLQKITNKMSCTICYKNIYYTVKVFFGVFVPFTFLSKQICMGSYYDEEVSCATWHQGPIWWFLKIFLPRRLQKIAAFTQDMYVSLCYIYLCKWIKTLFLKKNADFFAKNWRQSQ